jgi:hypothetical protein
METNILELIEKSVTRLEGMILSNGDKDAILTELAAIKAIIDYALFTEDKTISMEDVELTLAEPDENVGEMHS